MVGLNHGGGRGPDGSPTACVFVDKQTALVPGRPLVVKLGRRDNGSPVRVLGIAIERTPGNGKFVPLNSCEKAKRRKGPPERAFSVASL